MKIFRTRSLTLHVTFLYALIACIAVGGLGSYLYISARTALEIRADTGLIARMRHFRHLMRDLYNFEQMRERPALFETMLGSEQDVLMFNRPGEAPFIHNNPDRMTPPPMQPQPLGATLTPAALHTGMRDDGIRVRWVSALAQVGDHGQTVQITAAYVMTQEAAILSAYFRQMILVVVVTGLLTILFGFIVIRRGLRPLALIAQRAASITPTNLSVRLREEEVPQELQRLAGAFNTMLDRLNEGYVRLSQFSADLAHEIRTPIGILMGQTQVALSRERSTDEYKTTLASNLEELNLLGNMVGDILFLAHADHDGLAIECITLNIRDELNRLIDYFECIAEERGIRFNIEAGGELYANRDMWRRAVCNLILNAIRYAQPDTLVQLRGWNTAGHAVIAIENSIDPLPPEQVVHFFDRFYRGDQSRSKFSESNGLGLAIVRAIMHLHGGSAEASCPRDDMIRFSLYFPHRA